MSATRIVEAGDAMLVAEFGDEIDPALNARAVAFAGRLERDPFPGVRDVVPTFRSVAVYFDPLRTDVEALRDRLRRLAESVASFSVAVGSRTIVIPVCYGAGFGPDLPDVARFAGVSEAEVVARHCAVPYRVFMIGFMPGFAYLGEVDESIAAPRRSTPRTHVPAGSVGLAGRQTGVYPRDSPGGWQIIGRTPRTLFAIDREPQCLLRAGDTVMFEPLDADRFNRARESAGTT